MNDLMNNVERLHNSIIMNNVYYQSENQPVSNEKQLLTFIS